MVAQEPSAALLEEIRVLVERHVALHGFGVVRSELLNAWESEAASIVHVAPRLEAAEVEADEDLVTEGAA